MLFPPLPELDLQFVPTGIAWLQTCQLTFEPHLRAARIVALIEVIGEDEPGGIFFVLLLRREEQASEGVGGWNEMRHRWLGRDHGDSRRSSSPIASNAVRS